MIPGRAAILDRQARCTLAGRDPIQALVLIVARNEEGDLSDNHIVPCRNLIIMDPLVRRRDE